MKPALPALLTSFGILLATVAHALWPHYAGPLVTCLIGALGIAAALLVSKPTDAAWIQALEQGLEKTAPAQLAELRSARKAKLPPPMLHLFVFTMLLGTMQACGASPQQRQTTIDDSLKVASCVIADVLGGQTDPLRIGGDCISAVPSLIVQIIDDFLAQKALPDAGFAAVAPTLTVEQRGYLQDARTKAVQALAQKATGK